jgi:predicted HTH domain antitoxin
METKICKCCGRELPIESFMKNGLGVSATCKECVQAKKQSKREETKRLQKQAIDAINARALKLSDFTPRELMEELARRGYEGKLKVVHIEEIDITKF